MTNLERRSVIASALAAIGSARARDSEAGRREERTEQRRPISLPITRNQFRDLRIDQTTIQVLGYRSEGDPGMGAVYTSNSATGDGPGAIQDAVGTWFNLVMGDTVPAGWFGVIGDDGTDNAAALAAAVAAAPDHSSIVLPTGIVCLGSKGLLISLRKGLKFIGGTIKLVGLSAIPVSSLGKFGIVFESCENCGLVRTTLLGNSQGGVVGFFHCRRSGLWSCEVSGAGTGNAQVTSLYGESSQFVDNIVRDSGGTSTRGLWIGNVQKLEFETGAHIVGNRVYNNSATGIVYTGAEGVIAENRVTNNQGAGIVISASETISSYGVSVVGNICTDNLFHGIQCDSGDLTHKLPLAAAPYGVSVAGNVCIRNRYSGIFINDAVGWSVTGNECFDNVTAGILCDDNLSDIVISGNACFDSRAGNARTQNTGIRCVANVAAGAYRNVAVSGNVCTNHIDGDGIMIQSNSSNEMRGISISGNTCSKNDRAGISIAEESPGKVSAVLSGNVCLDNGVSDIRATAEDISIGTNAYKVAIGIDYLTFRDGVHEPNVYSRVSWRFLNSGPTIVTRLAGYATGQQVQLYAGNGNTTLVHSDHLVLKNGKNVSLTPRSFIFFRNMDGIWIETSRSF